MKNGIGKLGKKLYLGATVAPFFVAAIQNSAFAAITITDPNGKALPTTTGTAVPDATKTIGKGLQLFYDIVMGIGGVMTAAGFVFAAIMFYRSIGSPENRKLAWGGLGAAFIGAVVFFSGLGLSGFAGGIGKQIFG